MIILQNVIKRIRANTVSCAREQIDLNFFNQQYSFGKYLEKVHFVHCLILKNRCFFIQINN